jgi:hypothetical protein
MLQTAQLGAARPTIRERNKCSIRGIPLKPSNYRIRRGSDAQLTSLFVRKLDTQDVLVDKQKGAGFTPAPHGFDYV